MKTLFPGYYRPTKEEFSDLWKTATFALDANVLLKIYGYSERTRKTLLALLESIQARLWIPYQFAAEYQRHRVKSILEQVEHYRSVRSKLKTILNDHFKARHKHPFVASKSLRAFERLCEELERGQQKHEKLLSADPYFQHLSELLHGRVGTEPSANELASMSDEARRRYSQRIPPGYSDSAKPEPEAFGDYFGWKQILNHGSANHAPLIFLTDDRKEDWWFIQDSRPIGPRPELIAEYARTCGAAFYMYNLEHFMERAQQHLGQPVGPGVLLEIRERSAAEAQSSQEKASVATEGLKPIEIATPSFPLEPVKAEAGPPPSDESGDKPVAE